MSEFSSIGKYGEHIPRPKGAGKKILYLDYDGVLHHEDVYFKINVGCYFGPLACPGSNFFEWSHLLVDWLTPYPQVGIVLSTSWVPKRGFTFARRVLPPELKKRVVGATYHSSMDRMVFKRIPRGQQVENDLKRRMPASWVALDDCNEGWDWLKDDRLVVTDERLGLGAPGADKRTKEIFSLNFS